MDKWVFDLSLSFRVPQYNINTIEFGLEFRVTQYIDNFC